MIYYDSLLENSTYIITKCYAYFITRFDRSLLQNAMFITKCDSTMPVNKSIAYFFSHEDL